MIKLYIVDDESSVRNGLTECIDWQHYGIEVVGTGANGRKAYEDIEKLTPDIVITDIKMPQMDGIELSNLIRKRYPETEIIFLSGYDDVEYLKEAIKVEAVDYIFKPFTMDELDKVINKTIDKIKEREEKKILLAEMQRKIDESMPLLRERFITGVLTEECKDSKIEEKLDFLGIKLPVDSKYCVLLVSLDNHELVLEKLSEKDRQVCTLILRDICSKVIENERRGYIATLNTGTIAILLSLENTDDEYINAIAEKLKDNIKSEIEYDLTIGIGCIVDGFCKIRNSYLTAKEAVKCKLYYGKNKIIVFDSLSMKYNDNVNSLMMFDEGKFMNILYMGAQDRACQYIDEVFNSLVEANSNRSSIIIVSMQIALAILKQFFQLNISRSDGLSEAGIMDKIQKLETIEDIKNYLKDLICEICEKTSKKRISEPRRIVNSVEEIINKRFNENITICEAIICLIFSTE